MDQNDHKYNFHLIKNCHISNSDVNCSKSTRNERRDLLWMLSIGLLLVTSSISMIILDPITITTNIVTSIKEGSYMYNIWKHVPYTVHSYVTVFNVTNADRFLNRLDDKIKLDEIGPFVFQETREMDAISYDSDRELLIMKPHLKVKFIPELSIGRLEDINLTVPNLVAIGVDTVSVENLPKWMSNIVSVGLLSYKQNLFQQLTVQQYLWGYEDPLITFASNTLPGWIDFEKVGLLDRYYGQPIQELAVDVSDSNTKYTIISANGQTGLKEQMFTDEQSRDNCNNVRGSFEGIMLTPNLNTTEDVFLYKSQGCRVFPFNYQKNGVTDFGIPFRRYSLNEDAFNRSTEYGCKCRSSATCLPEGISDLSKCYYGFPMRLSRPHFTGAEPRLLDRFDGLQPDDEKYHSYFDLEPVLGIVMNASSSIQINIEVKSLSSNSVTKPLDGLIFPLQTSHLRIAKLPTDIKTSLQFRFIYAPILVPVLEAAMIIIGTILIVIVIIRAPKSLSSNTVMTFPNQNKQLLNKVVSH